MKQLEPYQGALLGDPKSDMKGEKEQSAIGYFALACERMNEFARSLTAQSVFTDVRSGADIRYYENGWRLEKWVEAGLDPSGGLYAAWWLELGSDSAGQWIVESCLSISPDILFIGLPDRSAASLEQLEHCLATTVDDLEQALQQNERFAEEVKKHNRT